MNYKCLSIAGFDSSGGAGLQADLKTFSALGCYGMTVLTAVPVQNTCGVRGCYDLPVSCIQEQLEAIFEDIKPDSIKIGMLFSAPIIECVARFLSKNGKGVPIVMDPVMMAKSGDPLLKPDAIDALKSMLIPMTTIITPNLPEAYALCGREDTSHVIATELLSLGCQAVMLKGGHATGPTADDLYMDNQDHEEWFSAPRLISNNTHGTGCTLSAAISSFLAQKWSLVDSCKKAKQYLYDAMLASKDMVIGKGHGPVHHFYDWWE